MSQLLTLDVRDEDYVRNTKNISILLQEIQMFSFNNHQKIKMLKILLDRFMELSLSHIAFNKEVYKTLFKYLIENNTIKHLVIIFKIIPIRYVSKLIKLNANITHLDIDINIIHESTLKDYKNFCSALQFNKTLIEFRTVSYGPNLTGKRLEIFIDIFKSNYTLTNVRIDIEDYAKPIIETLINRNKRGGIRYITLYEILISCLVVGRKRIKWNKNFLKK
jgi:hypothetical protein